ncbi:MAG: DUF3365 domain-containing protein [Alteromonadaceae bacterium]|nr:DUF3365 domain-containing protein [Alteromonadaceae bacterium]
MSQTKPIMSVALLFCVSHMLSANTLQETSIDAASIQGSAATATELDQEAIKTEQLEVQAKQRINVFSTQLKKALLGAVQENGLKHAVSVCKEQAPVIAQNLSTDDWTIARTSLKTRNAENTPSDWEHAMLTLFDQRYKAGDQASSLHASIVKDNNFKYIQAIPTGKLCLACHGKSVEPSLLQQIQTNYPHDKATGFTLQDLRGAFVVTKSAITVSR